MGYEQAMGRAFSPRGLDGPEPWGFAQAGMGRAFGAYRATARHAIITKGAMNGARSLQVAEKNGVWANPPLY
jgi:hypothetical protein